MLWFGIWGALGTAWAAEGPVKDGIEPPPPAAAEAVLGCGTGAAPGMRLALVRTDEARAAIQEAFNATVAQDPTIFVWCGSRTGVALVDLERAPTAESFAAAIAAGEPWIAEDGPMTGAQSPPPKKAEVWDLNPVIDPNDARKGAGVTIFFLDGGLTDTLATGIRRGLGACFTDGGCPGPTSTCTDTPTSKGCAVCADGSPACAHGTAVSLLAGARVTTAPPTDRLGVAPDATARHARVLVDDGLGHPVGRESDLVRALEWVLAETAAASSPRPVVNLSLTLGGDSSRKVCAAARTPEATDDPPVLTALLALLAREPVVVAAAGPPVFDPKTGEVTDATGAPTFEWAPACLPGVVSVAAADRHGVLADWSNPGDLLAPGGPLVVEGSAQPVTGSSFAAAYVSGIYAALIGANQLPSVPAKWRSAATSGRCPPASTDVAPALCPAGLW